MRDSKHWLGFQWCKPSESGLASEADAVERRLSRLLCALGNEITEWVVEGGELTESVRNLKIDIIEKLKHDGWIVMAAGSGGYRVFRPATEEDRNALAEAAKGRETNDGYDAYTRLANQCLRRRRDVTA